MWKEILRKLSSRKLWLAIVGVLTGIAMAMGADATEIQTIAGATASVISIVAYIVVEGRVDAESVKNTIEIAEEAIDLLKKKE